MGLPESVHSIYGFLSPAEMDLLYHLAADVPAGGVIVEIGSFQGKSTVCLGLGAKVSGAKVWAVDPHEDHQVNETTHYGMENHAALLKNLVEFGVADVVRVVALSSMDALESWERHHPRLEIDLLWIDGSHDYEDAICDLRGWSWLVNDTWKAAGLIAIHDTSGHFPDVTRALDEFLAKGEWVVDERVAATTVLKRA